MERLALEDVDPDEFGEGGERRRLSTPLDTAAVALNHYRVAPGDGLPGGLHAHADQEEVFVVLAGVAVFEVIRADDADDTHDADGENGRAVDADGNLARGNEVRVAAGEAVRFAPGEFQSGRNAGEGDLLVLALGAPRETEDVRVPVPCPDCDHPDLRLDFAGGLSFGCPDCGTERRPAPCPECACEDLRTTLDDAGEPVVVCSDCGATFDSPPYAR